MKTPYEIKQIKADVAKLLERTAPGAAAKKRKADAIQKANIATFRSGQLLEGHTK
jgi:hypothetical protein